MGLKKITEKPLVTELTDNSTILITDDLLTNDLDENTDYLLRIKESDFKKELGINAVEEDVDQAKEDITNIKESILQLQTGKADLENGKVPFRQLPEVIAKEVVEVETFADLPAEGDYNKKYVVKNDADPTKNGVWEWIGIGYISINDAKNYYSIAIVNESTTMEQLKTAVDTVNAAGHHVLFDLHVFMTDAYVCTVHFFGESKCEIIDILNMKAYGRGDTYTGSQLVSDYCETGYNFIDKEYLETGYYTKEDSDRKYMRKPEKYGIRVSLNDSNPATRVEYLFDAIGKAPAKMNYTTGQFDLGGWANAWFVKNNFPCMVKSDGTLDYKLNPNDVSKKADGTASDVANTAYDGNAMAAMPTVWVKRFTTDDFYYIIFADEQIDETYFAKAHERDDLTIAPYAFYPMYKGSMISSKLRSLSGQRPQSFTTGTAELTAAQANGARWGIRNWLADELIFDLLKLIGKSTNLQLTFGRGHDSGGSAASSFLDTGTLDSKGAFFGYNDGIHAVKFFNIENFYAERWDRQEGMVYDNGVFKVAEHIKDSNFNGTGYHSMGYGCDAEGYQKTIEATEYGSFIKAVGASDTTYECDYFYRNQSGLRVPLVGGPCGSGARGGRSVRVNNAVSSASWYLGASPFLKNPL